MLRGRRKREEEEEAAEGMDRKEVRTSARELGSRDDDEEGDGPATMLLRRRQRASFASLYPSRCCFPRRPLATRASQKAPSPRSIGSGGSNGEQRGWKKRKKSRRWGIDDALRRRRFDSFFLFLFSSNEEEHVRVRHRAAKGSLSTRSIRKEKETGALFPPL